MGIAMGGSTQTPAPQPTTNFIDVVFPWLVGHRTQIITGALTFLNFAYQVAKVVAPIAGFTIPPMVGSLIGAANNVGLPAAGATLAAKIARS